ncbi:methylated-DNA--[protein]-cysteine S-methyltransferase [Coprobacillus cateniformis]|nr:methylated-DNA--[protein]-cysteine S-methyltransferase [Coprobacillus cateniformis]
MIYTTHYKSLIGEILLASDGDSLIGLWLENQKYFLATIKEETIDKPDLKVFIQTQLWLEHYFQGEKLSIKDLPLAPRGTPFRQEVWQILCEIPYGEVITYGEVAKKMAERHHKQTMSAQAIGGAVGHNPISIIIPCHRVVGTNGSLTGYAGGIDKKIKLLELEGVDMHHFFVPNHGTAL